MIMFSKLKGENADIKAANEEVSRVLKKYNMRLEIGQNIFIVPNEPKQDAFEKVGVKDGDAEAKSSDK